MAIKKRVASVKGTFLKPGISKNNRLYTPELIASAVTRMQEAIDSPDGLPITMATSHGAADKDDARSTVGRIVSVAVRPDGSAAFEADIADTTAGRDVASLVTPENPYVKGVSIRGRWLGDMMTDPSTNAVTAEGLEIRGIDFTSRPGVNDAQIESAQLYEAASDLDESFIFESADEVEFFEDEIADRDTDVSEGDDGESDLLEAARAFVELAEAKDTKPYGDVPYADNGYQSDGVKRYPIDTKAHVKSAWSYVNVESNATKYTPAQLKRVKSRIKSAAKKFGINITEDSALLRNEILELLEAASDDATVDYAVLADQLATTAQVGLYGADEAVASMVGDGHMPDDDNDMSPTHGVAALFCTHCSDGTPLPSTALYCPTCGQPVPQAESDSTADDATESIDTTQENPDMPEATETAVEATETPAETETAAPERNITDADATAIGEAFAKAMAAAAPAPITVAPVEVVATETAVETEVEAEVEAETAEPTLTIAEATEMAVAAAKAAVKEATDAAVADYRSTGGATRKGLVGGRIVRTADDLNEGGELDAHALAEMDQQEFRRVAGAAILQDPFFKALDARANARALSSR
jgi:hypothetical protein